MPAPIALFVYNRPWHTRQTVESLLANHLAKESDLFVFSDAAKGESAHSNVEEVRCYLRDIRGFRTTTIIERSENFGLARSIVGGVTRLCEEYGRAIVVEDDLVSSPYFLKFMNEALDTYQEIPEVMHISGSTYPVKQGDGVHSYFLRLPLCWGWGTWQRAWSSFRKDINVMRRFDDSMISRFNFDGTFPNYWQQLELNRDGKIDTWFVFWYAEIFLRRGLVLFPGRSLLRNIGNDGSGVHRVNTKDLDVEISPIPVSVERIALEESREAFERHKRYFRSIQPAIHERALRKAKGIVRRFLK